MLGFFLLTLFIAWKFSKTYFKFLIISLTGLCISIVITDHIRDYDAYLYHLQAIRWAKEGFLHLGIANIHPRLGFQSIWFDVQAMFDLSGILGYPLALLNGTIALGFFVWLIKKALERDTQWFAYAFLFFVLFFSTLDGPLYYLLRGYNPDIPAAFLTFAYFYYAYINKDWSFKVIKNLTILSLFAVLIKLSAIPLLFYSLMLIFYKLKHTKSWKQYLYLLGVIAITMAYYSIKNVLLTGYLLFPVSITKLPVLWAVPKEEVSVLSGVISSWAKIRAVNVEYFSLFNLQWIPTWYSQQTSQSLITILGGSISALTLGLLAFTHKNIHLDVVFGGLLGMLTYWFLMVPDVRFGLGILFVSLFICIAELIKLKKKKLAYLLGATFVIFLMRSVPPITNYYHWFRMVPKLHPAGLQSFPTKAIEVNGYTYYIPKEVGTDQTNYQDFPSTPHIDPCLQQKQVGPFTVHYKECN